MKEKTNDGGYVEGYVLSTGRTFDANCGLVGINGLLEVREGYDGHIYPDPDETTDVQGQPWTTAERAELADYMIALWQEFKARERPA